MQISLKWIDELVNIETIKIDDLIDKLTLGGFEVEEILEIEINQEKQIILDISATANRSDSLSIQGIATEIIALLDQKLKVSPYTSNSLDWKQKIKKLSSSSFESDLAVSKDFSLIENIQKKNYCSTFLAVIVENLMDTTTPKWIKDKLISSGITPVNNLLDLQNYILLETGYPFAFYDFEKLSTKLNDSKFTLSLENAKRDQNFSANNDVKYQLDESNILVKANNLPISIAGIIENEDVLYSESTNSLLIEGSIFTASNIRQQSRQLGLRTDRSARYEKSLKNTYLIESLYRLISLLRIKNPNLTCKVHTIFKINEPILNCILYDIKRLKKF
jgi:phenylalanyl-tRNA synthetase beta chain